MNAVWVDGKPERAWHRHVGPIRLATFAPDRGRETRLRQIEFCREAADAALAQAKHTIGEVGLFLGPQTIVWLNSTLAASLRVDPRRTFDTFTEVANLGSATFSYNMETALRRAMLKDGDLVLAYIPGAGLTRAATVFRWRSGGTRQARPDA